MRDLDYLVIGGGIAGLSAAAKLVKHGRAAVIEAEEALGYHSSGRSVSFSHYGIGNAAVRGMTAWSRDFFERQPEGFCETPISRVVPSLYMATAETMPGLEALYAEMARFTDAVQWIGPERIEQLCPVIRTGPGAIERAVEDPTGLKLDADALLQSYARAVRSGGGNPHRPADRCHRTGLDRHQRNRRALDSTDPCQRRGGLGRPGSGARRGPFTRSRTQTPHDHRRRSADRRGRPRLALRPCGRRKLLHASGSRPAPRFSGGRGRGRSLRCAAGGVRPRPRRAPARAVHHPHGFPHRPSLGGASIFRRRPGADRRLRVRRYGLQTAPAMAAAVEALATGGDWPEGLAELGVTAGTLGPERLFNGSPH